MKTSDEEILRQILEYLKDQRYKQAVMLNGEWGSGKTFFIKEKLIEYIQNELPDKKVYYVSLYGISSSDEITEEIYAAMIEEILESRTGKKTAKLIGKGITLASKVILTKLKDQDIDRDDIPKLSELKDLKNAIVILDDLERCELEINQVFGAINNLVEHQDIKTVIVANESEIGKLKLTKEFLKKYETGVINSNCKVNGEEKNNLEMTGYTKEQLMKKMQELLREDVSYRGVKEKLIGLTIYYKPNFAEIFVSVIDTYIRIPEAKKYLKNNKQKIVNIFNERKYYNIRTLIFSVIAFEKFYMIINSNSMNFEFDSGIYIAEEIEKVLLYTVTTAIQIKSAQTVNTWPAGTKYTMVYYKNKNTSSKIFGYKFVDDYLLHCILDEEEIKETITDIVTRTKKANNSKKERDDLKYNSLIYWWKLEDEEIEEMVSGIYEELQNHKYTPEYFEDIIICFIQIKNEGFECIDFEKTVTYMAEELENYKENFERKRMEISGDNRELIEEYNKIVKPLFNILDNRKAAKKENDNSFLCKHECWNEKFAEKCDYLRATYISDYALFSYIDPDIFIAEVEKAKVAEIYNFIDGINAIYSFENLNDFFRADVFNLQQIIKMLNVEKLSMEKKTRKKVISKLKNNLNGYLRLILHSAEELDIEDRLRF